MLNKEKIRKVDLYDTNGEHLLCTKSVSFPRDFFRIKSQELVVIRDKNIPDLDKDKPISVIFEYINGTRIKYETKIDICTEMQLNFHVDQGEVLKDRRNSYKVNASFDGISRFFERNDEPVLFDTPLAIHFHNINLGGVLFSADFDFVKGDLVNLVFMDNHMELMGEVLRLQTDLSGQFVGYGCKFAEVSHTQEELLAKFIFQCQVDERVKNSRTLKQLF